MLNIYEVYYHDDGEGIQTDSFWIEKSNAEKRRDEVSHGIIQYEIIEWEIQDSLGVEFCENH